MGPQRVAGKEWPGRRGRIPDLGAAVRSVRGRAHSQERACEDSRAEVPPRRRHRRRDARLVTEREPAAGAGHARADGDRQGQGPTGASDGGPERAPSRAYRPARIGAGREVEGGAPYFFVIVNFAPDTPRLNPSPVPVSASETSPLVSAWAVVDFTAPASASVAA